MRGPGVRLDLGTPVIPPLFAALVDDAALFPPGNAPIDEAVPAHQRHHQSWYGDVVGPFVCLDTRLGEITAPLRVSVVVSGGTAEVRPPAGVDVVAIEMRGIPARADLPVYAEVPLSELDVVARKGFRAKLRTGGAVVPTEAEVAEFVTGCVDRKIVFKCTAGLHHAVRNTVGDVDQHGFLNILLAVDSALRGSSTADLVDILAERDEQAVAHAVRGIGDPEAVRGQFASFGSCSIDEPIEDLVRLGLLVPGGTS